MMRLIVRVALAKRLQPRRSQRGAVLTATLDRSSALVAAHPARAAKERHPCRYTTLRGLVRAARWRRQMRRGAHVQSNAGRCRQPLCECAQNGSVTHSHERQKTTAQR